MALQATAIPALVLLAGLVGGLLPFLFLLFRQANLPRTKRIRLRDDPLVLGLNLLAFPALAVFLVLIQFETDMSPLLALQVGASAPVVVQQFTRRGTQASGNVG